MSACDTCREPGACCKRLWLFRASGDVTSWTQLDALVFAASEWLPFLLHGDERRYETEDGTPYFRYAYKCPLLDANGRCSDYEHRPELCRDFEPLSSPLCVEFVA